MTASEGARCGHAVYEAGFGWHVDRMDHAFVPPKEGGTVSECEASGPDPDLLDRLAGCPKHKAPYYACIINAERRRLASRDAEIARLSAALDEHHKSRPHPNSAQCLPCLRATARVPGPFHDEARRALTPPVATNEGGLGT